MPPERSIPQKIVANTIANAVGRCWAILVALFLTPYIIRHIGNERYGILAIVGVLTGYFGLLDLGVGTSFVKYIAEYHAKKDSEKLNQVINTGIVFYAAFALILIAAVFLSTDRLLDFFKVPPPLRDETTFVLWLGIVIFGASNILSIFGAIQAGLQRMDITNKISIAMSLPNIAGTIFVLERGYGLPGLVANNAVILAISSGIDIAVAFKIFPKLSVHSLLFDKTMFKKLFSYGYKLQTSRIATLFHLGIDKVLLARFLDISQVTFYAIGSSFASKARDLPLLLISAVLPAASELDARADKGQLVNLYMRTMKYTILIGLPLAAAAVLFAHPFMDLWLGKGYARAAVTLQVLMLGYFLNVITGPGFTILNGIGRPEYGMRSSVLAAALNLVLSVVLVIKVGYFGVVAGTTIAMIAASGYFLFMCHRVIGVALRECLGRIILVPLVVCAIACGVISIFIRTTAQVGWTALLGLSALYAVMYAAGILKTGYLDDFDRSLLKKFVLGRPA